VDRIDVPMVVSRLMGDRPARWTPPSLAVGDYDGRERTLEVFNAAAVEQLDLLKAIRSLRAELKEAAGGSIVFIFHTPEESLRLYADFLNGYPRPIVGALSARGFMGRLEDQEVKAGEARPHRRAA
jgi:hypothetical protein